MDIYGLVLSAVILLITFVVLSCLTIRLVSKRRPEIFRYDSEKFYLDRQNGGKKVFPFGTTSGESDSSVYLSIIIPAYNEEKRLPVMLDEAFEYLERRSKQSEKFTYEVIIVDDGSKDKTTEVGLDYVEKYGVAKCRVLTLFKNRGKGGAVRLGTLSSRGQLVLFADADGATKFSEFEKLEKAIEGAGPENVIAVGSRSHLEEDAIATRSAIRTFLMHGFHFIVWFFAVRTVRDTQCGFKLFGRNVAHLLFSWIHVERWAFDVELIYLCEHLSIEVKELPVTWTEIDGSKVVPVFSWLQMGRDVFKIFLMYKVGAWEAPVYSKNK
ncbi:Dolichyl-phosphate beta-glucosyltransferase [Halotydeus destructor]|nr:Dolichyl-phosphate beta-glucosyltransferase [Halotydeus destructor]